MVKILKITWHFSAVMSICSNPGGGGWWCAKNIAAAVGGAVGIGGMLGTKFSPAGINSWEDLIGLWR